MIKRSAFTLIETLISLAIIVSVLGSVVIVNRIVQTSALQSESNTQLSSLVAESVEHLQALRDAKPGDNAATGVSNFYTALAFPPNGTTAQGLFVARTAVPNPCASDPGMTQYCNPRDEGGPVLLEWCNPDSTTANFCTIQPTGFKENGQAQTLGGMYSIHSKAELIAIRKTPSTEADIDKRSVVDASSDTNLLPLTVDVNSSQWVFYQRTITIKQVTVNSVVQGALPVETYSYAATITVTQYGAPKIAMSRTILLYAPQ